MTNEEEETDTNTDHESDNTDNHTAIKNTTFLKELFQHLNDVSDWSIPVSDSVRIGIITKGLN